MNKTLTIPAIFNEVASKFSDKTALKIKRDGDWFKLRYSQVRENALKVAAFLIKEGCRKNDAACIILENCPEWPVIYLGIVYAGLTCVPLDAHLTGQEVKSLAADSGAKILFCSREIYSSKIEKNIGDDRIKPFVLENFSDIENITAPPAFLPEVDPDDIASLIYTSGTTALPKGVLLSHNNICSNAMSLLKLDICLESDSTLSILPLHHTYAFMVALVVPLFLGATVTYCPSFKAEDISRTIREGRISIFPGVPQLFSMLHKAISERVKKIPRVLLFFLLPFIRPKIRQELGNSLRLLVSGGARLDPRTGRGLSRLLGIKMVEGYGLTETSPVVTLNPVKKIKFGSVGLPIPDVQIRILNPDRSGVGQVLIKGPNVMRGYFKHPEWSRAVIKDGWFYSGDLGYIDAEGYLFLVGREKDVIVLSSGKNIYPEELEEYYGKSPFIKEICIMDVKQERFGQLIDTLQAVVVPDLEYFKRKKMSDVQGKIRWELENLASALPSHNHIMGFILTKDELPRTALRKIKRYKVKEKYFSRGEPNGKPNGEGRLEAAQEAVFSEEDARLLDKEVARKTIDYISREIKRPVNLNSHLEIDLGIDSLTKVDLALGLEELFKVKLPEELFYSISTIKELIIKLSEITGEGRHKADETRKTWSQILSKPSDKKLQAEPRFADKLFTLACKISFTIILKVFWLLKVKGRDNLPASGPYLVCPNHASYLDGFFVFIGLSRRLTDLFFLGYSDILEHPLLKWAIKPARLIPIDPNTNLTDAMQAVSYLLSQGKIVCIFPEGRRSINENIGKFKKGIGILIRELNIPVVPAYIKGSYKSWPRTKRFPRFYPVKVIFGRPKTAKDLLEGKAGKDDYETIAANLREEVIGLADPQNLQKVDSNH
ncbi:MAG: AMP-binding protein [Candidatus Omnitrophica bacterium]|nr:AMP-binding protein [Candidatus Omnitrophota bacterium]MDD5552306.1 AMP-binding protein [Candidatus Omnitrophota bacterium]